MGRRFVAGVALVTVAAGAGAAVIYGPEFLNRYGDRLFSRSQCTVTLDDQSHQLTAQQADNAALISAVSARRGLPARAATIALATAFQESDLRNIDYGDRDSVGLFQQRPSQGWGSVEEIMDPHYSAGAFYDELVTISDWRDADITVAAQAVQRSAFPEAYGQHESASRLWASGLRGHSGAMPVDCSLTGTSTGTAESFEERLTADFGTRKFTVTVVDSTAEWDLVEITAQSGADVDLNTVSAWAVATASTTGVHAVAWDGAAWSRGDVPLADADAVAVTIAKDAG